jgi:hypothetical protein
MGDVGAGNAAQPKPQLDISKLKVVSDAVATAVKQAAVARGFAPAILPAAAGIAAPLPEAKADKPGKERWPVKTGVDEDVAEVGQNAAAGAGADGIVDTTVEELIQIPRPPDMSDINGFQTEFQERRAKPFEVTIWRVTADIIAIKKEADGDFHIVLQGDSGETMIAEAPTARPPFVGPESPWFDAMKEVRRRIGDQFGPSFAGVAFQPMNAKFLMPAPPGAPGLLAVPAAPPPAAPGAAETDIFDLAPPFKAKVPQTRAVIVGVGFFDRVHGQMGVALENGAELHAILSIEFP